LMWAIPYEHVLFEFHGNHWKIMKNRGDPSGFYATPLGNYTHGIQ